MLVKASAISGYSISATDGHLGKVADFYFDDERWVVRWLVVDTSHWLTGRKVLLPVSALGHPNTDDKTFSVRLTKQQVKDSPDIDTEIPVSRQTEGNVFDHYGWSPYWDSGMYMVGALPISPPMIPKNLEAIRAGEIIRAREDQSDPHLRRTKTVTGHHIHAWDGEIGHVKDFILEGAGQEGADLSPLGKGYRLADQAGQSGCQPRAGEGQSGLPRRDHRRPRL